MLTADVDENSRTLSWQIEPFDSVTIQNMSTNRLLRSSNNSWTRLIKPNPFNLRIILFDGNLFWKYS